MFHHSQGAGYQYKLILQRKDPGTTLLGDLLHLDLKLPWIEYPLAALHRVFLGKYVPLEVFNVNRTALAPEQLCDYLTRLNAGALYFPLWSYRKLICSDSYAC